MDDISGSRTKRATQDETLFPELKENHEDHPHDTDKDSHNPKNKRGHAQSLWQRWRAGTIQNQLTVAFTALIFVATSAYAIFSGYQLSVMKQQLQEIKSGSGDTHELAIAAGKQADAAKKQSTQAEAQTTKMAESLTRTDKLIGATSELAKEAKRSADIARDALAQSSKTFRLDQRAWVMGLRFSVSQEPEPNKAFSITVWLTNTGKTAAINVIPQSRIILWHEEPQSPPFILQNEVRSRGMLTPGATGFRFENAQNTLDEAQVIGYKSGSYKVYVQAKINYTDVFEVAHWTTLCIYHTYGKPLDEWEYCGHGNDTDH